MDNSNILTVEDVQRYLKIGRSSAYNLFGQPDFPTIRIGKQIRVKEDDFFIWLNKQTQKVGDR